MSSYFYLQAEKNSKNADLLNRLGDYADYSKELIYVLNKPLGDVKYNYAYKSALIILAPKSKILFLDYGKNN